MRVIGTSVEIGRIRVVTDIDMCTHAIRVCLPHLGQYKPYIQCVQSDFQQKIKYFWILIEF